MLKRGKYILRSMIPFVSQGCENSELFKNNNGWEMGLYSSKYELYIMNSLKYERGTGE